MQIQKCGYDNDDTIDKLFKCFLGQCSLCQNTEMKLNMNIIYNELKYYMSLAKT